MEERESLKDLRKSMMQSGASPNFDGAVYLAEGLWIYTDGSLREF